MAGRIESGHIQLGESILVLPANEIASIKGENRFSFLNMHFKYSSIVNHILCHKGPSVAGLIVAQ